MSDRLLEYLLTKTIGEALYCEVCGFELDPTDVGSKCQDCEEAARSEPPTDR